MRSCGDSGPHRFGALSGGALLSFSDALIITQPLSLSFIALVFGDGGEDVDRELAGGWHVAANEVNLVVH